MPSLVTRVPSFLPPPAWGCPARRTSASDRWPGRSCAQRRTSRRETPSCRRSCHRETCRWRRTRSPGHPPPPVEVLEHGRELPAGGAPVGREVVEDKILALQSLVSLHFAAVSLDESSSFQGIHCLSSSCLW